MYFRLRSFNSALIFESFWSVQRNIFSKTLSFFSLLSHSIKKKSHNKIPNKILILLTSQFYRQSCIWFLETQVKKFQIYKNNQMTNTFFVRLNFTRREIQHIINCFKIMKINYFLLLEDFFSIFHLLYFSPVHLEWGSDREFLYIEKNWVPLIFKRQEWEIDITSRTKWTRS